VYNIYAALYVKNISSAFAHTHTHTQLHKYARVTYIIYYILYRYTSQCWRYDLIKFSLIKLRARQKVDVYILYFIFKNSFSRIFLPPRRRHSCTTDLTSRSRGEGSPEKNGEDEFNFTKLLGVSTKRDRNNNNNNNTSNRMIFINFHHSFFVI